MTNINIKTNDVLVGKQRRPQRKTRASQDTHFYNCQRRKALREQGAQVGGIAVVVHAVAAGHAAQCNLLRSARIVTGNDEAPYILVEATKMLLHRNQPFSRANGVLRRDGRQLCNGDF